MAMQNRQMTPSGHAATIEQRFCAVQERITLACQRVGRRADEITLIGVTKTFPMDVVTLGLGAGIRDFGENRVQELTEKAQAMPGGATHRWHMIGHLQRNKARAVVAYAATFHALDSLRLATVLDQRSAEAGRVLPCFVQVNVSGEGSKFGFAPEEAPSALVRLAEYANLRIIGLMTLAAPVRDPEEVRPQFRLLRTLLEQNLDLLAEQSLSMGMSGDFEVAIEEGATHIRLGSVIFGPRGALAR